MGARGGGGQRLEFPGAPSPASLPAAWSHSAPCRLPSLRQPPLVQVPPAWVGQKTGGGGAARQTLHMLMCFFLTKMEPHMGLQSP